jgi:hypothetical protein
MAIMGVPGRWLRNKKDGTIYNYNHILCKNPGVEEVSEEIAFPEKHIPEAQVGREPKVDLSTAEEVVEKAKPKAKKGTGQTVSAKGGRKR